MSIPQNKSQPHRIPPTNKLTVSDMKFKPLKQRTYALQLHNVCSTLEPHFHTTSQHHLNRKSVYSSDKQKRLHRLRDQSYAFNL